MHGCCARGRGCLRAKGEHPPVGQKLDDEPRFQIGIDAECSAVVLVRIFKLARLESFVSQQLPVCTDTMMSRIVGALMSPPYASSRHSKSGQDSNLSVNALLRQGADFLQASSHSSVIRVPAQRFLVEARRPCDVSTAVRAAGAQRKDLCQRATSS